MHLGWKLALLLLAVPAVALGQSADPFAGVVPRPVGVFQTHGAVRYMPPAGWKVSSGPEGITILSGPVAPQELPCEIWMLPAMSVQRDLPSEGLALVNSLAAAKNFGAYRDERGRDVRLSREEGTSGNGWAYADLSGQLGNSGITVRVLMAELGGGSALPIIGYSRTWNCLGNQSMRDNDVWALLFHSLQIPGFANVSPHLVHELIGTWSSASGSAGNSYRFTQNGRFGGVSLSQSYAPSMTPGMVVEIDRSWQGDGSYEVHGDRLHTRNPNGSETERDVTRFFSIVRMPNEKAPGGFDQVLRVVRRSSDGGQVWGFGPNGNYILSMTKERTAQPPR